MEASDFQPLPAEEAVRVAVRVKPLSAEDHERGYSTFHSIEDCSITIIPPPDLSSASSTVVQRTPTRPSMTPILRREQSTPNSLQRRAGTPRAVPPSPLASPMRGPGGTPSSVNRTLQRPEEPRTFTFDRLFDDKATQSQVFDYVRPLVDAAVDGYNSTLFTYGQTGSGKTYTMFGTEEHPGLIPRAVRRMFDLIASRTDTVFVVKCSFVELHLDNFNDLLDVENHPSFKHKQLPNWRPKKIEIREDSRTGAVFLAGSDTLYTPVESVRHARDIIQAGMRLRTSAATKMNERSSRSHAILTFYIESRSALAESAPVTMGKLHLVDLAGSERLVRSVVEGQNKKEAQQINASLTALGDVLEVLSKPAKPGGAASGLVPYRNNKLTRLLQDSLGGNSKTCFIINIQTTAPNYRETLTSLKYAHRAKMIKNKVSVNKDLFGASDIQALTTEINHLKARLEERNRAYEAISEQQKSIGAENKELRAQIESLSRINKEEKTTLEHQIGSIIHNKESLLIEQQHDFAVLQSKLDKRRKVSHDLKVKLAMVEGEVLELKEKLKAAQMEAARLTTERDHARKQADKFQKKLKKTLALGEEERKVTQQRVLDLEAMLEEADRYRRKVQKEREEGRDAAALQEEYEEKVRTLEQTVAASNKQVRLLLQQLEKTKEDSGDKESQLQKEIQSLRTQLQAAQQKTSQTEEKLHKEIRLLRSQTESQRMSIETFEEKERMREMEVNRRRASAKRTRAQQQTDEHREDDDEEEPERRGHADHFEEKLTTTNKKKAKSDRDRDAEANAAPAAAATNGATGRPVNLKSKGSTLKSLFPVTALPLGDDAGGEEEDDEKEKSDTPPRAKKGAANSKKTKKAAKEKPARKSKGKKRLSEEMLSADYEAEEDKENLANAKSHFGIASSSSSSSSGSGSGGSQLKKRKLFTANGKEVEKSAAFSSSSLASSAVSIGPVTKALMNKKGSGIPLSSKSSLQRLLQAQKTQLPKLKSQN